MKDNVAINSEAPQPLKEREKEKGSYNETQFSTLEEKGADALEMAEKTHQKRKAKAQGAGFIRLFLNIFLGEKNFLKNRAVKKKSEIRSKSSTPSDSFIKKILVQPSYHA